MTDFCIPDGKILKIEELCVPKARDLTLALVQEKIDFAHFIECRTSEEGETIVIDVEVEVAQIRKNPINTRERIAVIFYKQDDRLPEVLALRSDFPKVPHLNLKEKEIPRSLCLYDERYRDLKNKWTSQRFIARLREWLKLTAQGRLHQDDQPLEPLILNYAGNIVLPNSLLYDFGNPPDKLFVFRRSDKNDMLFLIADTIGTTGGAALEMVSSVHLTPAKQHGYIYKRPETLAEVSQLIQESGLNIINELRGRLTDWLKESSKDSNFLDAPLILIIICPKTREEGTEVESTDIWAFITEDTFKEIGIKIGIWDQQDGYVVPLLSTDQSKNGNDIKVDILNTSFYLTREQAARLNGLDNIIDTKITAIGVGALGSQVVMNLAKSGTGAWTLIDDDILMPHNVTRHALSSFDIGFPKSSRLAFVTNDLIRDMDLFTAITADVIEPKQHEENVSRALKDANIIIDMSASVTVARYIALDIDSSARRFSLYLNPSGEELVLLAEHNDRSIKLDELEFQFYRAIVQETDLANHFKPSEGRRRYGRICRDITNTLSQNTIAIHAGIASHAIQQTIQSESSQITIWKSDTLGNVKRIDIPVHQSIHCQMGEWTVKIDNDLIRKLSSLRTVKLPNETGGVLTGSFDLERKIIYIIDTIPSPPDSEEWPTLYIRGCKGLREQIEDNSIKTAGMLEYIGEWHSHPKGGNTVPSKDDLQVFSWITEWMDRDGFPAVMMIVGDNTKISCFVGEIEQAERLITS